MKLLEKVHQIIGKRIRHIARIQEIVATGFERTDNPRCFVRRMEVAGFVASQIGQTLGKRLCIDILAAVEPMGYESIWLGGRGYYRHVKRKGMSDEEAMQISREDIRRSVHGPAQ